MFRPILVKALPDYRLSVRFDNGVEGEVSLRHLVGRGVFVLWCDEDVFEKVHIGTEGQIAWSDTIEICPDAVYMSITGLTPEQLFPNLAQDTVRA